MLYDGCRGDTAWAESVKCSLREVAKNIEEQNKLLERIAKALEVKEDIKEEEKNGKQ
jgi:uncharacterized protein YwgA